MFSAAFIQSSVDGDLIQLETFLKKGTDINTRGEKGWTALHNASYYGHASLADLLIRNGANVNLRGDGGTTALMNAAYSGNYEIIKSLVEKGAEVNAKDSYDWVPLLFALIYKNGKTNRNQIITYLLENGAEVNSRNSAGWTAIMKTVNESEFELTKTLIKHGANVNDRYLAEGNTSLLIRASQKDDLEILKLLVNNGADINSKSEMENITAFGIISDRLNMLTSLWKPEKLAYCSLEELIQTTLFPLHCKPYLEVLELLKSKGGS